MDIIAGEVPQCTLRTKTRLNHCERLRSLHRATGATGNINDGAWACNTGACLIACGKGSRKTDVTEQTACLALQSLQKMCEWRLHDAPGSSADAEALAVYKTTLAHMYERQKTVRKRRAEDPEQQRWTRETACTELAAIHTKLGAEYVRVLQMDAGPERAADITRLLHVGIIFGIDATDQMPSLRGGNWPLVRFAEAAVHPFLDRMGHWLAMTDDGCVLHAPESTKPRPGEDPRPIVLHLDALSPKIGTLLSMLQTFATQERDGWVFPPQKKGAFLYRRDAAGNILLGAKYTANDGRHLSYCAEHGNPAERAEKAARRGSTSASAAAYGGGRC